MEPSGKTTLARQIAATHGMAFRTLDDAQTCAFARQDPRGFVRGLDRAVIDEIQRVPEIILSIKQTVDDDTRAGRFLITVSADLFGGALSPDSLAGRSKRMNCFPCLNPRWQGGRHLISSTKPSMVM